MHLAMQYDFSFSKAFRGFQKLSEILLFASKWFWHAFSKCILRELAKSRMFKSVLQWAKILCLCSRSVPILPISYLYWFGDEHWLLPQDSGSCDPSPPGNCDWRCPGHSWFPLTLEAKICALFCVVHAPCTHMISTCIYTSHDLDYQHTSTW